MSISSTRSRASALARVILPLCICFAVAGTASAQPTLAGPLIGAQWQERFFIEAGYGGIWATWGGENTNSHGALPGGMGASISGLVSPGERTIYGADASIWAMLVFLEAGVGISCLSDNHEWTLRLRPEIGCGVHNIRMVYVVDIPIVNQSFKELTRGEFRFVWVIPLVKNG